MSEGRKEGVPLVHPFYAPFNEQDTGVWLVIFGFCGVLYTILHSR